MGRRFAAWLVAALGGIVLLQGEPLGVTGSPAQGPFEPAVARGAGVKAGGEEVLSGEFVPGEVIVRYRRGTDAQERAETRAEVGAELERTLPVPALEVVQVDPGTGVERVAAELERDPDVLYAEPNYVRRSARKGNDAYFGLLWALDNAGQPVAGRSGSADADIDAPEAWELSTGSADVTVAVVDGGIAYDHPDLAPNMWSNPGESGGVAGVDDDGNGRIDDIRGWDFVGRDNDPDDPDGHGTHVAGTIGARGNDGAGVAGVNWTVRLLPVRVLDASGSGTVANAIAAYAYAARMGAKVVNASLGGGGRSQAEADVFAAAPGTLFVVAAGNAAADNDVVADYPCDYEAANLICVAASDQADALASFSNYGATTVDLAAPGENILSTRPSHLPTYSGNEYRFSSGTSMATPHVAGAAALVLAQYPTASVAEVRARLLGSVDPRPSLAGRTVTGGRLNLFRALSAIPAAAPVVAVPAPAAPPAQAPPAPAPPAPAPPAPSPAPEPAAPEPPAAGEPAPAPPAAQPAPAPAPAPAPLASLPATPRPSAPAPARDLAAPAVSLSLPGRQPRKDVLARGLRPLVGCLERCTIRAEVLVGSRVVGRGSGRLSGRGRTAVLVRLSRASLEPVNPLRVVLRARVVDLSGNARSLSRILTLTG